MKDITIIHATNHNQQVLIGCVAYEFEFTQVDLANVIKRHYTTSELEQLSELDSENNNSGTMAMEIASYWFNEDVELLIQDFIDNQPQNLSDHLQVTKN